MYVYIFVCLVDSTCLQGGAIYLDDYKSLGTFENCNFISNIADVSLEELDDPISVAFALSFILTLFLFPLFPIVHLHLIEECKFSCSHFHKFTVNPPVQSRTFSLLHFPPAIRHEMLLSIFCDRDHPPLICFSNVVNK